MKMLEIFTCPMVNDGITSTIMNYHTYIDHSRIVTDFVAINSNVPEKWKIKIKSFNGNLFIIKNRNKNPIGYIKKLYKIIKNGKYDTIRAHGNSSTLFIEMLAAKLAGCKNRIAHSHNSKTNHPFINICCKPLFLALYNRAFACSDSAGKWLFGKRSFDIIKNGNNLQKFKFNNIIREKYRKQFNIDDKKNILLHIGLFVNQKNHDFLLKVFDLFSKNNDALLFLVGNGPLINDIYDKVKYYNLESKVFFLDNRDDIECLMDMSDIFIFPSKFEGLPNVLVEAQASNLPILASDKISKEVNITNNIMFLPINNDSDIHEWVIQLERVSKNNRCGSEEVIDLLKSHGYDIRENAIKLQKMLLQMSE